MQLHNSSRHIHARMRFWLMLLFILTAAALAGCSQSASKTQATASPTPFIVPTATRTSSPAPTLTSSPSPTPSVTPTPGIFDRVPAVPGESRFSVVTPDATMLWDVVRMAGKVGERDGDDQNLEKISDTERDALYRLVEHDLQTYYPRGIPETMELVENRQFAVNGNSPFINSLIPENLLVKLNQERVTFSSEKSVMVEDFDLLPLQLELDGDTKPEWMLKVSNNRLSYMDWIYIDELDDSSYELIPGDSPASPMNSMAAQVEVNHDLTGDGRGEIVFSWFEYAWGSEFGYVQIFTFDGTRVTRILNIERYLRSTDFSDLESVAIEYSLNDANGDGREEIQIKLPRSANFGCEWQEISSYRWEGLQPKFQLRGANPPETPICWVAQALNPKTPLLPEQKMQLLERALPNITAPDLVALVRVHLAASYAMQGKDAQAQQALAGLDRLPPNGTLVRTIQEQYKSANGSVLSLCDSLYRYPFEPTSAFPKHGDILVYLNYSSSLGAYMYDGAIYPPMVCPLSDLAKHLLENAQLPSASAPLEALKKAGFPVGAFAEIQLDKDAAKEISAVIDLAEPQIIILDQGEEFWNVSRAARLSGPADSVQLLAYDIYQDEQIELLVSAELKDPTPYSAFTSCWGPEAGKTNQYFAIRGANGHFDAFWGDELCGEGQDLMSSAKNHLFEFALIQGEPLAADQSLADNHRLRYAFSLEEVYLLGEKGMWRGMNELLEEILAADPAVPSDRKMKAVMEWVSPEEPGGERLIQRMLFFTGYYYEQIGEPEQAGEFYTQLVQQWPDSIWSWLAWARLSPSTGLGV